MLEDFGDSNRVNVFYNTTAPFAPFSAVNFFSNSVLKKATGKPNAYIKSTLNPFIYTAKIASYEKAAGGMVMAIFVSLGYLFITANWIVTYVRER